MKLGWGRGVGDVLGMGMGTEGQRPEARGQRPETGGRRIQRTASLGVSLDFETDILKLWVGKLVRLDFEFEFEAKRKRKRSVA